VTGVNIGTMFGAADAPTFFGLPACDDLASLNARAAILGVPLATPYPSVGPYCAGAPRAIRAAMAPFSNSAGHVNFDFGEPVFASDGPSAVDCGDLSLDATTPAANRELIRQSINILLDRGAVPVVIGGDDSVPIPLFDAFAGRGEFTIVQIDAHIDWRDSVDGERFGLSSNMRRASEMSHITRIVQIGQRAIGSARPGDRDDALRWGAELIPARELSRHGIAPVLERIAPGSEVLLTLDIDGMDPTVVPGVIGRAPGGLDYWQVVELIHGVAGRGRIAAFDLVEFMPERDVDQLGANVAAHLILNVLAAIHRGA
jgi:agmatinase